MLFVDFQLGPRGGARMREKLDGRFYGLDVIWRPQESVWSLTISDATGVVLRAGLWLRHGERLLEGSSDPRLPPGYFLVWDTSRRQLDPGRRDLRKDSAVRLIYYTAAEVAA